MKDFENIELLLDGYFSGNLSEEETARVDEWINEDEENRKTALRFYRLWQGLSCMNGRMSGRTEAALDNVHRKMRKSRRIRFMTFIQKTAAVLLLPFAVATGYYAYMHHHVDESEWIEVKTTTGMVSCLTLPDSSKVWLNSNSTLRYPARFYGRNRDVCLDGEAFFNVSRREGRTFTVNTESMQVQVLGTEFNVDAYSDTGREVRTTLLSGSVVITYQDTSGKMQSRMMKPGDQVSYDPERGVTSSRTVNPRLSSSWKDGKIVLDGTSLSEALRMIENRYNVKFLVKNTDLLKNRYTGVFVDQSLDVILEHFRKTTKIDFDRDVAQVSDGSTVSGRQMIIVH